MRQLSGQDATFVFLESSAAPLHLTTLYIYDPSTAPGGKVTHKQLLAYIASRLDTSRVFTQKLLHVPMDLDFPYWVDDQDFDLEFHVRHIALPSPRDWRQLCILTSRLHSRGLDMARPPWEMYIIEGLDNVEGVPKGSFAVLSKYHHAAIDGASGVEIISGLHDLGAKPVAHKQVDRQAQSMPSSMQLLARSAANNIRLPLRLASVLARSRPQLNWLPRRSEPEEQRFEPPRGPIPKTRFNYPVSAHRVFTGRALDLEDFKTIRAAVPGVTINDVILATCAGALRDYLQDKEELPDAPLVAAVPINTRTDADEGVTGNVIAAMSIALQTHVADPVQRLQEIRDLTAAEKTTEKGVSARRMTDITHHLPATTLTMASRLISATGLMHRTRPVFNLVITNVPGPQVPLYQCGAELLATWGCGPVLDGVGLLISAHSYNGKLFLCATSCRDIMTDPSFFAQCLQQSFDELYRATQPAKKRKRRKTQAKASKRSRRR